MWGVLSLGGILTMEDLKSYKVQVESPWTVPLGSNQMHIAPPPAGGALLAFILKIMEGFKSFVVTQMVFFECAC